MRKVSSGRPRRSRSGSIPSVCALALGPHAGELDERRGGEAHVLDADPLALAVRVVPAGEDVRRGQAHLGQRGPVGAAPDRGLLRLEADAPDRLLEVPDDLRVPLDRLARVAVLDPLLDLDRAARLDGAHLVGKSAQERDVLRQPLVVEVTDDEAQLDLRRVALDHDRVHVSVAAFRRLGRAGVLRETTKDLGRDLDRVHELSLRPPGMDRTAVDAQAHLRAGERLRLQLAGGRAVDGVARSGAEALDGEVHDAAADLLVRVERDLHGAVRDLRLRGEMGDRGHDLGHAGLVVGSEQRRPVGRDQLVPDVVRELRRLLRADRLTRVAERDLAAPVAQALRRDAPPAHLARRVDVREERDRRHLVLHRGRECRGHVAVLVERRVGEAQPLELVAEEPQQHELALGARVRVRLLVGLRIETDVAEEALGRVLRQPRGELRGHRASVRSGRAPAPRPTLRRPAPVRDQLVAARPRRARARSVGRLPPGARAADPVRDRDVGDPRRRRRPPALDPAAAASGARHAEQRRPRGRDDGRRPRARARATRAGGTRGLPRRRRVPERRRDGRVHRRRPRAGPARRPDDGARRARTLDPRRPHGDRGDGARDGLAARRDGRRRDGGLRARHRPARARVRPALRPRAADAGERPGGRIAAVGLALASAVLFGAMSVALRIALDRDRDVALGSIATAATALVVALAAAGAESPSRGLHLSSAWPFLLAGLLSPGAAQILVTLAIRESGSSRVSMVFGTAPLVSVTIALIVLGEPASPPLLAGAVLVVAGGVELARERERPAHLNRLGLLYALAGATLFAVRDNLVRHLAVGKTAVPPAVAAAAALLGGTVLIALWARQGIDRRWLRFVPAGLLFGASYVSLFEAYYRGRVTIVAPLVAVESLAGVALSALLLRESELVGKRLLAGVVLIVAGGALIGAYR